MLGTGAFIAIALLSAAAFAVVEILANRIAKKPYSTGVQIALSVGLVLIGLLPLLPFLWEITLTWQLLYGLGAVICVIGANIFYVNSHRRTDPTTLSIFSGLEPVVTLLVIALIADNTYPITLRTVLIVLLISLGVVIQVRGHPEKNHIPFALGMTAAYALGGVLAAKAITSGTINFYTYFFIRSLLVSLAFILLFRVKRTEFKTAWSQDWKLFTIKSCYLLIGYLTYFFLVQQHFNLSILVALTHTTPLMLLAAALLTRQRKLKTMEILAFLMAIIGIILLEI